MDDEDEIELLLREVALPDVGDADAWEDPNWLQDDRGEWI